MDGFPLDSGVHRVESHGAECCYAWQEALSLGARASRPLLGRLDIAASHGDTITCRRISDMDRVLRKNSDTFERDIQRLHQLIEGCDATVTWSDRIPDPDNPNQPRQIDVTINRGENLTLVECRLHKSRQDVQWIEELIGRKQSLRASCVIGVSSSGFTRGALEKAKRFGVFLRDLRELTAQEVQSWGKKIELTVYFYQYEGLQLLLSLNPGSVSKLTPEGIGNELKNFAGRPSLFNAAADELDKVTGEGLKQDTVRFGIKCVLADFIVCGEPVVEVELAGSARLVAKQIAFPAILAYGVPTEDPLDRDAVLQRSDAGETSVVVQGSRRVGTTIDLSALELPPNSQFRYVHVAAETEMDMDLFEILGAENIYTQGGPMKVIVRDALRTGV